jgi:hypothetical protein
MPVAQEPMVTTINAAALTSRGESISGGKSRIIAAITTESRNATDFRFTISK